jgi:hypothetical protein
MMQRFARRGIFAALLFAASAGWGAIAKTQTDELARRLLTAAAGHTGAAQITTELADETGPRLTWSPNLDLADAWVSARLSRLGLTNIHREVLEQRGLGWQKSLVWLRMVTPDSMMMYSEPAPWSVSSRGTQSAAAVLFDPHGIADLARYRGLLRGKAVLYGAARVPEPNTTPFIERLNDNHAVESSLGTLRTYYANRVGRLKHFQKDAVFADAVAAFLIREHPIVVITEGRSMPDGGESGIIAADEPPFPASGKAWIARYRFPIPILYTVPEQYNRAARLVVRKIPVRLQWHVATSSLGTRAAYNLIADMRGTDPALSTQIVLVGAHLDSWTDATGAIDDGAGVGTLLEAGRLLKDVGFRPRRTIRFIFYAGEEQGLFGAQSYADAHLGSVPRSETPEQLAVPVLSWRSPNGPLVRGPEWTKVSAVFDIDNGSGKVRGIFAGGGNPQFAAELEGWVAPLADSGVQEVLDEPDWPADQWVFQSLGLPTIDFVQDPLDYDTRIHHTSLDTPDHLNAADLEQASVTLAYLVAKLGGDSAMAPRPSEVPY